MRERRGLNTTRAEGQVTHSVPGWCGPGRNVSEDRKHVGHVDMGKGRGEHTSVSAKPGSHWPFSEDCDPEEAQLHGTH